MVPYLVFVPIFCFGAENAYKGPVTFPTIVVLLLSSFGSKTAIVGNVTDPLYYIYCKYSIIIQEIYARTVPSNVAIWDEFINQHQH